MLSIEYFQVECYDETGREYYEQLAEVVLLDHNMLRVVHKLHIFIDPRIPIFVATGVTKTIHSHITVNDFANVQIEGGKVTIAIGEETYLSELLRILWEKFGKDHVDQPDRFTIILNLTKEEAQKIADMVVVDPSENLYRDLIYALQVIAPEGFKVRRQYYGKERFYYIASENTLTESADVLIREKFAPMGESL